METEAAEEALRNFGEQSGLAVLVEQYVWYFVIAFALLFVKDSVTNALAGIAMFLGSDYNEDMVCWLHTNGTRRPARRLHYFLHHFIYTRLKTDRLQEEHY